MGGPHSQVIANPNFFFFFFLFFRFEKFSIISCLLFSSSKNGRYIQSPEFRAEHVSLDCPRLNLKPRPALMGPKYMGQAPQPMGREGFQNWPLDQDFGGMEESNQRQTRHAEQVYLRAQGPNLKA